MYNLIEEVAATPQPKMTLILKELVALQR